MFNGTDWSALGSDGDTGSAFRGPVFDISISGNHVYVGGVFNDAGNNYPATNAADYVAAWDGTLWHPLGSNGDGNGSLNNEVHAVAASGDTVYAGGLFINLNNNGTILQNADCLAGYQMPDASPSPVLVIPSPAGVERPFMKSVAIFSESLVTQAGITNGSIQNLNLIDQSEAEDDPAAYLTFQTPEGIYLGYQSFFLPEDARSKTVHAALLQVNFKGDASTIWSWSIYDWTSNRWVSLGDTIGIEANQWQSLIFRIRQPERKVSPEGEIRIQLRSSNALGDANVDYEGIHITYLSIPAAPTPFVPPIPPDRPRIFSSPNSTLQP
jgi:hypothetical protein